MREKNSLETIIKWAIVVVLAVVALKLVFTVLGIAFVLGSFLLFRVLPLLLIVWLMVRLFGWFRGTGDTAGSAAAPAADSTEI
ncbi:MAG TPA: hypothetical protein VFH27_15210 [Longimicrobiaceae bacterium]|nr:hypothetical protein [Longimicrobiaceae bacterium]